jgi:hypothetical protein
MLHCHDRDSTVRALALDLDPHLKSLLRLRLKTLSTGEFDLTAQTEFLVVEAGDREEDIIRNVGFSPLTEPLDGLRFGKRGFTPFWDWLAHHDGWFELTISFGSTFAYILLIQDGAGVLPELLALCRCYA